MEAQTGSPGKPELQREESEPTAVGGSPGRGQEAAGPGQAGLLASS